jgi:prophage antirepressor-like protein
MSKQGDEQHYSNLTNRYVTTQSKNRYSSFTRKTEMIFVSNDDVSRLADHSKRPDASEFGHWLFGSVLSIKQTVANKSMITPAFGTDPSGMAELSGSIINIGGIPCYEKDGVVYLTLKFA